jgi:hypothetical protein
MDITVKPSSNSIQFNLPLVSANANLPCPDSAAVAAQQVDCSGWQVNAIVGNTSGAFGTKADHHGNRKRLVYLSYNGDQKGYLELTRYNGYLGHIEIEPYGHALLGDPTTNTPPVPSLSTICQLIKAADELVAKSEVGHLYIIPFHIKGEITMGARTVTVD